MKSMVPLCLVALAAACATAPTDIALNANEPASTGATKTSTVPTNEAVLIMSIGPVATGGSYQFQRLNNERTDFADDPVILGFGAWGIGDKMKRAKGDKSSTWNLTLDQEEINFLIKKVEAGTYVATYVSWSTFNGVSSGSAWNCLNEGSATYDIKAGQINLLSSADAFPRGSVSRISKTVTDEQILDQFERTRVNYPELEGKPHLLSPTLETRWTEGKSGFFSDGCSNIAPGSMVVADIGQSAEDRELDEADNAAIAAALENLRQKQDASETTSRGE